MTVKSSMFLPLLMITLIVYNYFKYGTRVQVAKSWFGTTLTVSNGIAVIGSNLLGSAWVSDYEYLLFKDEASVPIPSGNYSMAASFA
jgi:hypothetical protein